MLLKTLRRRGGEGLGLDHWKLSTSLLGEMSWTKIKTQDRVGGPGRDQWTVSVVMPSRHRAGTKRPSVVVEEGRGQCFLRVGIGEREGHPLNTLMKINHHQDVRDTRGREKRGRVQEIKYLNVIKDCGQLLLETTMEKVIGHHLLLVLND